MADVPANDGSSEPPEIDQTLIQPAADAPLPSDLPVIPGITLSREIARGGMGVVYRGTQDYLDRAVAVKVLAAQLEGDEFAARFQREAKILAGINHPHIVACHQAGVTPDGRCYLAMEFVGGQNLQEWLDDHGCMPVRSALRVILNLVQALSHAHSQGIIHRDVKAANVLMDESVTVRRLDPQFPFRAKLVDLGLAKFAHGQGLAGDLMVTSPGTVMGTPSTMSPEQFDDPDHVDFRADIYGLGCILHRTLVGAPAYGQRSMTETIQAKRERFGPNPREVNSAIPEAVGLLVTRMLACNREERPASYQELSIALEMLIDSTPEGLSVCAASPSLDATMVDTPAPPTTQSEAGGGPDKLMQTAELNFLMDAEGDVQAADNNPNPDMFASVVAAAPQGTDSSIGMTSAAAGFDGASSPELRPVEPPAKASAPSGRGLQLGVGVLGVAGLCAAVIAWWPGSAPDDSQSPDSVPSAASSAGDSLSPGDSAPAGADGAKLAGGQAVAASGEDADADAAAEAVVPNRAPTGSFECPEDVKIGDVITLRADVVDLDGDPVELSWRMRSRGVLVEFLDRNETTATMKILDAVPRETARIELSLRDGVTPPVSIERKFRVADPQPTLLFGDDRATALSQWSAAAAEDRGAWTPREDDEVAGVRRDGLSYRTTQLPDGLWSIRGEFYTHPTFTQSGQRYADRVGVRLVVDPAAKSGANQLALSLSREGARCTLSLCNVLEAAPLDWQFEPIVGASVSWEIDLEGADDLDALDVDQEKSTAFFRFTRRRGQIEFAFSPPGAAGREGVLDCATPIETRAAFSMFVDRGIARFRDLQVR